MDIEQYINSGIIESYVLGAASNQEQQEVSCLSAIYPEIKEAVSAAQQSLEKYITSLAVKPPTDLKVNVLESIKEVKQLEVAEKQTVKEVKTAVIKKVNFAKYGLVASVLLIVGLFYVLKIGSEKLTNSEQELTQQTEIVNDLQNDLVAKSSTYQDSIQELKNRNQFLSSEDTKLIALAGTELNPDSKVRVFWNKSQSEIVVIQDYLPSPNEKQYQLWAISNGQPVNLGVLDKNGVTTENRKIDISEVDAFAITLEVEGGAPSPDLSQLYVIGNT